MSNSQSNSYPNLAARVLNTPLLLEPGYARIFFSALSSRLGIQSLKDAEGTILTGEKLHVTASAYSNNRDRDRPYRVIDGVAVLPVSGSLVHKLGAIRPYSGMTGYDGLIYRITDAVNDPDIDGILLDIDSPGGEVAGCFDCSDMIFKLGQQKPIASLCYDMNCSAAQAIAAATSKRYITQNGSAGSIGVLMAHASYEKMLEEEGIKVTLIHSGQHKVEGNPYEDLSEEVLARFQNKTDSLRQLFAEKVAHYIPGMDINAVLATEAQVYRGQDAIDIGLADEMVNGLEAVEVFRDYLSGQSTTSISTGVSMTVEKTTAKADNGQPAGGDNKPDTAQADTPVTTQQETASTEAAKPEAAASDERSRVQGILKCEEAGGRAEMAEHLAFNTDMSVDEAKGLLAVAPKQAQAATGATALETAMSGVHQPNVSADTSDSEDDDDQDLVKQALAAHSVATGSQYGDQ